MLELRLNAHRSCIHYFIEAGTNSRSALDDLLRAMIKQLVVSHDQTILAFPPEILKALRIFKVSGFPPPTDDLVRLLKMLVDYSPPSMYLIDGLDDLDETQLLDMFDMLRRIFAEHNSHGSKLALFSRETLGRGIDIERQLTGLSQVHVLRLTLAHLSKDIARFVEAEVNRQQIRRLITTNEALVNEVKKKLIAHSGKM